MAKKRINPFTGKLIRENTDNESIEDIMKEMREMEKILGKENFNRLLQETIDKMDYEDLQDESLDEIDDDEELYDLDPVVTKEWSETHPASLVCASDSYYADMANDLADIVSSYKVSIPASDEFARELGRVMAAYLEDNVSGTKIFSAMRRVCKERYGYPLPFYDCQHPDYLQDHINVEDIKFLIWKTACLHGKEYNKTYSPLAPGWDLLSERIFEELDSRYEEAPEARRVADWLERALRKEDYIDIREIASWLVLRNPLCYKPDYLNQIQDEVVDAALEKNADTRSISTVLYGIVSSEAWQRSMSPMGCPSRTLTAAIAAEFGYSALAEEIETIEVLPNQIYAVSQDKKSRKILFETCQHVKLEVQRQSFAKGFRPDEIQYAQCTLLNYKSEYLLNGMLTGNPDLRKTWEKQSPLLTFEQNREQASEYIDMLDGRQVFCVKSLNAFMKKLGLSPENGKEGSDAENYIVILSKELGLAILPDMGYAFDIPGNRFFRKRAAEKNSFGRLIFHNEMPHDVAMYIQEHNLLPLASIGASQGKETGLRIVQDYLAFWIGFYRELPTYGDMPKFIADEDID